MGGLLDGVGDMLGGIPIVGGMAKGILGGGSKPQAQPQQQSPYAGGAYPGFPQTQGPGAYPGWPVPGPGPQPTYNFQGDFSKPGQAESFFANNQGSFGAPKESTDYWQQNKSRFGAPGQGDQFWNQAMGSFNGQKPGTNNAETAYQDFKTSTPANTAPYYEHALETATNKATRSAANAGLLGNSATQQGMQDLSANILGQQALADANYGLQRGGMMGQLGGAADASSRANSQNQLGWLSGLGGLGLGLQNSDLQRTMGGMNAAGGLDQLGLQSIMSGMNAAGGAQAAQRARGQDYFNNQNQLGMQSAGILGNTYGQMLGADQGLFSDQMQAMLGLPREQLNQSIGGRKNTEEGIGNLAGLMGSFMGGMM